MNNKIDKYEILIPISNVWQVVGFAYNWRDKDVVGACLSKGKFCDLVVARGFEKDMDDFIVLNISIYINGKLNFSGTCEEFACADAEHIIDIKSRFDISTLPEFKI